jgi:hypothetical protein
MVEIVNKVLDYETKLLVPDSVDEYNAMDKTRGNACLEDAIKYNVLHSWNSEAREEIVSVLETLTGIKRQMKPGATKKDGSPGAEVPAETPATYKGRALAESNKSHEETVDEVLKVLSKIAFDPSPGERTGGAGRIPKEFYGMADGLVEKGPEALTKGVRKLKKLNPGLEIATLEDGSINRDSLAVAFRTNFQRKLSEARDEILA